MEDFHYSLIRFVPDRARGESLNLGIIVVAHDEPNAACELLTHYRERLRLLDPYVDARVIERILASIQARVGVFQVSLESDDAPINSVANLTALSASLKNQIQVDPPKPYRATSLDAALNELFADLVSRQRKPVVSKSGMSLAELRRLIRQTIKEWGSEALKVEEDKLEQGRDARHYADFWLQSGRPTAAFIAIPDDPGERDVAWARRDSVKTIAEEFSHLNPLFKTVVVFPPNGHIPPKAFVSETIGLLGGQRGVIVTHVDELESKRSEIAQANQARLAI